MKVAFTAPALHDLEEVRAYLSAHYPGVMASVERRLRLAYARIGAWPQSGRVVAERPEARVVSIVRYPTRFSTLWLLI
jgi:plasmid stabilization system protein ParE